MWAVNVKGTENIIKACIECNVAKLVYSSTADVILGWSENCNLNESTNATEVMQSKPNVIAGKAFCIGDHTPNKNFFDFLEPYLAATGSTLLNISIPYSIIIFFAFILELIVWILRPFGKISVPFTRSSIYCVCKGMTISWNKAKKELGYAPIYSYEESKNNTVQYLVKNFVA